MQSARRRENLEFPVQRCRADAEPRNSYWNSAELELFSPRHGRVAQQRYFTEGRTEPDPDFGNAVKSYLPGLILIATLGDKCCDKDYTFEILRYNLFAP